MVDFCVGRVLLLMIHDMVDGSVIIISYLFSVDVVCVV